MSLHYQESNPILLGSGELFLCKASEIVDPENVTPEEEAKFVNIGAIESGANIDIATTRQDIKSSNRGLIAKLKVDTNVKFSTGVCTWNLSNISRFLTGSKYTEDATKGERKMVIGKDDQSEVVYLRFIHDKKTKDGQLIVNMYKAIFDGDLSFVFNTDNPTTLNYEFVALTTNSGNYVEFVETFPIEG